MPDHASGSNDTGCPSPDTAPDRPVPPPSGLLEALHAVQSKHGYVPRAQALQVSRKMGIPLARIFEVLTFYSFFRLEKPGKIRIAVCLGTSCHLQGGRELLAALEEMLGVRAGEATPDGLFQLDVVRCLGCCGRSPVLQINEKIYSQVATADLPAILQAHTAAAAAAEGDG